MRTKALVLVASMMAVAGCTLSRSDQRHDQSDTTTSLLGQVNGGGGQVIEPKRCALKVVILPRPLRDKVVDESVWTVADEQVIAPEVRRALQANGLRVGVITGSLPAAVEAAVNAPPPNRVDPAEFNLPDGSDTQVSLSETSPEVSLLLNRDGRAFGRDYKDASGRFFVTASHDGPTGVALRFVPEIHHGPVLRRYDSLTGNGGALNTMQFMLRDGQQKEILRELATALTLQPGQVVVIGCDPDRRGSLGSFLFTQAEADSDRLIQKILLVWASRNDNGEPGSQPSPTEMPRPRLLPVEPPELPVSDRGKPRAIDKPS